MNPPPVTRQEFYTRCLDQLRAKPPYVWGGKSLNGCDCSGFVTLALYEASAHLLDWRVTHNTDMLWKLPRLATADVLPGDLAIYYGASTGPEDVSHVMVCAGVGLCFGQAWGSSSDVDPAKSRIAGKVTIVRPIAYRSDLAGFVRLPIT